MWAMPHSRIAGMNARFAERKARHGSVQDDMARDSTEPGSKSKAALFLKANTLDSNAQRVEERVCVGLDCDRLQAALDRVRCLQAVACDEQDDLVVPADLAAAHGLAQRA